ncbi:kinase-like domain-containing protein [Dichotomocladium elegans]|nr:kinase-like domain-containing protein [Dichotomocladium elegans]
MSSVFHFEDEDLAALQRKSIDESAFISRLDDLSLRDPATGQESGYSSENDTAEPIRVSADERLYEVSLNQDFVSSSVKDESKIPRKRVYKEDFEVLKLLGRGAYGKVTLCRHAATKKLYAMKVLKKASLFVHSKNAEYMKTERQILEEVRHPFIVQLMYAFQTDDRLFLILEYAMGGELFTHMAAEQMFSERVARFYIAELVLALGHLHSVGIVYRDLKPENCLLDAEGHVLLTDFGLSKVAVDGKANTFCGTAEYMAPEVLMEMNYDKSVDWWTLGILMFEMLTGDTPFRAANHKKTMDAIQNKKLQIPYYVTSEAKDLLNRLLRKNPNTRLGHGDDGTEQVKAHKWFKRVKWSQMEGREVQPPIVPIIVSFESRIRECGGGWR